jgi:GNAT superfamily N-acetyltransferase
VTPASASDRESLVRILADVFLADHAPYIPERLNPDFVETYSRDLVARAWSKMALGRAGGEAVGMVYVQGNKIEALNVAAGWKRRGVGRTLLHWAEAIIAAAGHRNVAVDTQEANEPARAFYEAMGYHVTRRWPLTEFTATPIPMVTMSKGPSGAPSRHGAGDVR